MHRAGFQKIIFILFGILFVLVLIYGALYFILPPRSEKITYGVTFSLPYAMNLNLDWRETYLAILDDLGVKNIRLPIYWTDIERAPGEFFFEDYDFLLAEAQKREVNIIPVIGQKVPRWPECYIPEWLLGEDEHVKQERMILMIKTIVDRYKHYPNIKMWQIENEPFVAWFGICPKLDKKFLEKEIAEVRSLDSRPIMITESGEFSTWYRASKMGDYLGVTLYRRVYEEKSNFYWTHYIPPSFYWLRARLWGKFPERVIISELQAEPWVKNPPISNASLEEQYQTMNFQFFKENLEFAQKTGISEIYFWGAEWWYWMKEKQNSPEIWNEARKLF